MKPVDFLSRSQMTIRKRIKIIFLSQIDKIMW